jgi:two-component system response regulator YesN
MIQVLIVDDDKLVRKGLMSSMPWKDYDMEIVGEANNGENALIFMENHAIDLLITDLAMPVMSGVELMRIVRDKYPHVQIVVLTLHQNFEYVQEALRLGAIDYIAKIQLEKEQFEAVLSRIVSLMGHSAGWKNTLHQDNIWEQSDELQVLYVLNQLDDGARRPNVPESAIEADIGIWYWSGSQTITPDIQNEAMIGFRGLTGMDRNSVLQLIRTYRKIDLFYCYNPSEPYQTVDAAEILRQTPKTNTVSMDTIIQLWVTAEWIYDDTTWQDRLAGLKGLRLPPVRLARIFYSITDQWNRLYQQILESPILIEDFFASWHFFEEWLRSAREQIRSANTKPLLSKEIQSSILKAISLAHLHVSEPISATDIAQRVNMSSSYFSQCFKQYAGQTYTDYVRDLRMERAKEYLNNTTKTIQWIAEQIGYNDEKYFSRLFREQIGMLPSEYRQQAEKRS